MRRVFVCITLAAVFCMGYAGAQIGGAWTDAQITVAITEIGATINNDRKRLVQAKALIDAADAELGGLAATYGAVGTAIDNALTANPGNAFYESLDAQWDSLVVEFQALKAESAAQKAALEAL